MATALTLVSSGQIFYANPVLLLVRFSLLWFWFHDSAFYRTFIAHI